MQLAFLEPTFGSRPDQPWVGLFVVVALGVAALWVHRIAHGEGEYRSFRATLHGESRVATVAVGLTISALAALLVVPVIASAIRL